MADDVKLIFTGDSAAAEKALANLERKYDALEAKIKRIGTATKDSARDGVSGFQAMADSTGAVLRNLTGLSDQTSVFLNGLQLVKQEWQDLERRQQQAMGSGQRFSIAMENLAIDTFGDPTLPLQKAKAESLRIGRKYGVDPSIVAANISTGVSSKGALPASDVIPAVETVTRTIPQLFEAQSLMVGVVNDVRKFAPQAKPEDVLGFAQQIKMQARVTDFGELARNVMPSVVGLAKLEGGDAEDFRFAGAVAAAMTQAAQDPSGRKSRTAGVSLALQLKEFLPELGGMQERMEFMQQNPAARQAFLYGGEFGGKKRKGLSMQVTGPDGQTMELAADRASFERQMFPAIEGLLTGGSKDAANIQSAYKAIPELLQGAALNRQFVAELRSDPTVQAADQSRRFKYQAESTRIGDTYGARVGGLRGGVEDVMSSAGVGWLDRLQARWAFEARHYLMGQSPEDAAINTLEGARDRYSGGAGHSLSRAMFGDSMGATVEKLGEAVEELKGIKQNTQPQINRNAQVE